MPASSLTARLTQQVSLRGRRVDGSVSITVEQNRVGYIDWRKMSDYEDNMDVDAAPSVQFNSSDNNGKAKRTAADLPVGAQDNLPW